MRVTGAAPRLVSPALNADADGYQEVVVRYRTSSGLPPTLLWKALAGSGSFRESLVPAVVEGNGWVVAVAKLWKNSNWPESRGASRMTLDFSATAESEPVLVHAVIIGH